MSYSNNGFPRSNTPPPSYVSAVADSPPPSYEAFVNASQSPPTSVQRQGNANLQHLSRAARDVPGADHPAAGSSDFSASSRNAGEAGEAGDELGAPPIFRNRSTLQRQLSQAAHRVTHTTSKVDQFDLEQAVFQRMDRGLVGSFRDARTAFNREVGILERHLARDPSDTAVADGRRRLARCLGELEDVSHRLCERCLKPTRAFVEQALLRHRGRERLTGHDQRLIAAAFEELSLETVERDLAAAHAAYARLVPDAPRSNPGDLQRLRRT